MPIPSRCGSDERGAIFRVDPLSGETVPVTSAGSLVDPTGVSVGVNGGLLVSDRSALPDEFVAALFSVDPNTGEQELISSEGDLVSPTDLVMVPHRCRGRFATVLGTGGDDDLRGTPYADVFVTYAGRDVVSAGGGNDIICGGGGPDVLGGAKGIDALYGQGGSDKLFGGTGKDRLRGGPGVDLIRP